MLSPYQCGFRKRYSTELATISLSNSVLRSMDQGMLTGSVFIDLKKAFDTVDHDLLIEKLFRYGVRNSELLWFRNYLHDRSQVVQYENSLSPPSRISTGVPQGSVLGPLLFVLFINDLPDCIIKCSILMYADDTVLFFSARCPKVIETTLNSQLSIVNDWLQDNFLFLNVKKTEVVLFGTSGNLAKVDNFTITIAQKQIKRVMEYKYFGVVMDDKLSWKSQIAYIVSKAGKRIGLLGRIRKQLTTYSASKIFKAFIRPIFDYCDCTWAGCNKTDSNTLERLQRRAARIVLKTASRDVALESLKWGNLYNRRNEHILKLVNKCLKGCTPQHFKQYFTYNRDIMTRTTRQSNLLHLPRVRLEATKKSFFYNGCIVFNSFK